MALVAGNGAARVYNGSSSISANGTFSIQPASGDEATIEEIIVTGRARLMSYSATGSVTIEDLTPGVPYTIPHRVTNSEYLQVIDTSGAANVCFYKGLQTDASARPGVIQIDVINNTGSAIAKDKLVAISGYDTTSAKPRIVLADADVAAHDDLWVTTASIDDGAAGIVYKQALSTANLNTNSASAAGDPVYLSTTAGGFAHTAPSTAISRVHPAGFVVVKSATVGQIQWVLGPSRKIGTNELQASAVTSDILADAAAIRQKISLQVINKTGVSIAADKLVAVSSLDATSGKPKIVLADADVAAHDDVWVTTAAIADSAEGVVVKSALSAATLNTNSITSAGDPVYLDTTAGAFAVTAPTGATARVQPVGMVVVKSATVGQILWSIGPARKIGTNELQADSVTATEIAADTITNTEINSAAAIAYSKLNLGTSIVDADVSASAAIARSKLAEDALAVHAIPFSQVVQPTGIPLVATETAGAHNINITADVPILEGEVTNNETEVSVSYFQFALPPSYVAAQDVKVRVVAKRNGGEDVGALSTVDISAFKEGADGTVGADICATAAATLTTSYVTTDFVITAATLSPGDVLMVKLTTSVVDDAAGTTGKANITRLAVLCDIKG